MANRNTAIRGVQIRDGEITTTQLSSAVGISLGLADTAIQPGDVDGTTIEVATGGVVQVVDGGITETQLNVSVNASLDLADSALQSIAGGSITETELSVSVNASLDLADSAMQPGEEVVSFLDLTDNDEAGYTGHAGDVVRVNAGADGIEFYTLPTDPTSIIVEGDIVVEDLTGNADTSLTLANTPLASSVQLFINGLLQEEGSGKDYTIATTAITLAVATVADDIVIAHYIKLGA